ncbi:hypothetical protein [Novosphingobium sp. Leaf2]|uniref:hypothetical protein n=1 Tax=Novosphingobium sp. Leaf2 TaxID=1735670 RepID=UPI0007014CE3|nr:hypothetical protein [Novosphingobium sp. Leaf2]KQM19592.1 hypothetical protein ASE49_05060 [Novosphingobium sp. Leaf2]
MSDSQKFSGAAVPEAIETKDDRKVVRDATFIRVVADEVLPLPLGRDVELICLQVSPLIHGINDEGDYYEPEVEPVWAEVARLRMNYGDVVKMAMTILHQGIVLDRIKGHVVVGQITQWLEDIEKQGAGYES